ncbi:XRE family transcriptional regulator [Melaminivora suipulveris]|uniref:XRE family transcriptional regulator n=1 Tax=Melaminivora suipulveris TaxID=2109913 RepID=A0A2R3QFD9_9BURK|nr:XRE family transcriptional regulator [Melaminivora suipulveris]
MSDIQVIAQGGKPAFYVVPAALWEKVRDVLEGLEDEAAFDLATAQDDGTRIPAPVAFAVAGGSHPMRAWREHRGLSQEALAQAASLSKPYISQIESGRRAGSAATIKKIAAALGTTVDALML